MDSARLSPPARANPATFTSTESLHGLSSPANAPDHRRSSNRSIAYGIAKACHREGAELAFSYVGERFKDRVTEFAAEFGSKLVFDCDVGDDAQIVACSRSWASTGRNSTVWCTRSASPRARPSPVTSWTA